MFGEVYGGKKVLITGHTGFKGSWLALWLNYLGAEVHGISIDNSLSDGHLSRLALPINETFVDIRNKAQIEQAVSEVAPEIVFHLAAQSTVRVGYENPSQTWETNVVGTLNLLNALKLEGTTRAIVVATTDKVYRNLEWSWGYREIDSLGGLDPYSASKAATEILVDSFRESFLVQAGIPIATVRAGNVVGGGDWTPDRLVTDLVHSLFSTSPLRLRNPSATRPWQHVLDCLSGYLLIGQALIEQKDASQGPWNIGPRSGKNLTVQALVDQFDSLAGTKVLRVSDSGFGHEANLLFLDTSKIRTFLGWSEVWDPKETINKTFEWYEAFHHQNSVISLDQLDSYLSDASVSSAIWNS